MKLPCGSTTYVGPVPSTQDLAMHRMTGIVWTDFQTSGRGRFAREWFSVQGQCLAASIVFEPYVHHPRPHLIGMACAIAVAQAFDCQLQWPNDVVWRGKKVAGILTELHEKTPVVGIGLNLGPRAVPPELAHRACSLYHQNQEQLDAEVALGRILEALRRLPEPRDWPDLRGHWMERDQTEGKLFTAFDGTVGSALGINEKGELVWSGGDQIRTLLVAEAFWPGHAEIPDNSGY